MKKVIFQNDSIIIQTNKAPIGWRPLWDDEIIAHKISDIPEEVFRSLSEEQVDSIFWFFEDKNQTEKGQTT